MQGKICIATTFDKNYKLAAQTLFKSIRHHTDCTGITFKIITADPEVVAEFGAENCHFVNDEIKARYANVKYSPELPPEKYHTSWYRYELFSLTEFDRVICIDSDCLCVRDISYLFSEDLAPFDLVSVEDHIVSKCFTRFVPQLEAQGLRFDGLRRRMRENQIDVQPALLIANKTLLTQDWYNGLIKYANETPFTYSIDEGILNDFIYLNNLKIHLLPLEWDYQDLYEIHCPDLPVPTQPFIVHCQESKPFKKNRADIDERMRKWHDKWHKEQAWNGKKTLVCVLVWNRFENLRRWIDCWKICETANADMVVIHNQESDNQRYQTLCEQNSIKYVPRENVGFDIGAFQDVCMERLAGFPNDWENLIWITDDCIPMQKNFVEHFLNRIERGFMPCYEISNEVRTHVRTTGFSVTKAVSKQLQFPADKITTREQCYQFEHLGNSLLDQFKKLGVKPVMLVDDLKRSSLWDSHCRNFLNLKAKHEQVFPPQPAEGDVPPASLGVLDDLAIKYQADKSSRYHNFAVKYDKLLTPYRLAFMKVLEIGVDRGQSLQMWAEFFPSAVIHGADNAEASAVCETLSNRIKFHLIDQGNEAQLKNLEQYSPFDLIIDDGNHWWNEQILTFKTLFPYLRSGGIYIIEDTCTSYWPEYKNHPQSCIEFLKGLVDDVHLRGARGVVPRNPPPEFGNWEKGWHRREDCHSNIPAFESIQFFNSFVVIYKR